MWLEALGAVERHRGLLGLLGGGCLLGLDVVRGLKEPGQREDHEGTDGADDELAGPVPVGEQGQDRPRHHVVRDARGDQVALALRRHGREYEEQEHDFEEHECPPAPDDVEGVVLAVLEP